MSELETRRAQLRALSEESDVAALERALSGADEEARRSLARTLPPSRLIRQEGPTPRACFALAALGKPSFVAETLTETDLGSQPSERIEAAIAALLAAAAGRTQQWRSDFAEAFALEFWWSGQRVVWPVLSALVHGYGIEPTAAYLDRFVSSITDEAAGDSPDVVGAKIAERLLTSPDLLEDFWALFRVEGSGSNYLLLEAAARAWEAALLRLADEPGLRSRLLDESVAALARDFAARHTIWYRRVHLLLQPNPTEVADRASRYLVLLGGQASTTVGLALETLLPAAKQGLLPAPALMEASGAVLGRTEKKLLKAQLSLLAAADLDAAQRDQVSQLVAQVSSAWSPDLIKAARPFLPEVPAGDSAPKKQTSGTRIDVAPPRAEPLAPRPAVPPVQSDQELFQLIAEQLEGVGPGADLPRILSYLIDRPELVAPTALAGRARKVLEDRPMYDIRDEAAASPRRQLAAVLLGDDAGQFRGYSRYVVVSADQEPPSGITQEHTITTARIDHESGQWIQESGTSRSGYQYFATNSATALLAETMRKARLFRKAGKQFTLPSPPPAAARDWVRELRTPGEGTFSRELEVLGPQPRAFWLAGPELAGRNAEFSARALSVADVAAEFTFRAQEAREQDGFDQLVGWASWLLQHNPDTLAAQFHPALYAAKTVVNVRGVGELLASIGASRQVPGAPTYSALGLGCAAKQQTHRAAAAEAIADLSDSGLLDPAAFAAQLSLLLGEGFVQAGRAAATLADAASISALAGYRVLQTLTELLPGLTEIRQPAQLVSLLARLAHEYGTPVDLPALLHRRAKAGSVLGDALAELASVRPGKTGPAEAAAQAAAVARES